MAALVATDLAAVQAQHARVDRLIRAGLVDLTPVIAQTTRQMYATAKADIASENSGRNPRRRPNTLLRGTPALGGASGSIARGTRIVGVKTRQQPTVYDILCFSTPVGAWMQDGTRAHRITAHNPSGRLAFPVAAAGSETRLRNVDRLRASATGRHRATRRTVADALLRSVAVSYRTPQSVQHPGTPPRPFLVYPHGYFDVHLWQPAVRYIATATEGTLGGVL